MFLLHDEAVKLLNEIAITNPQILQSATSINLQSGKKGVNIVIRSFLSLEDRELLEHLVNRRELGLYEQSDNLWLIY
jgi:hypothetical protein